MSKLTQSQLEELSESIETLIKTKYKKKFIGVIVGTTIGIAAASWLISIFGTELIKDSITDRLIKSILNDSVKNEIIASVSDSLTTPSDIILNDIKKNKEVSDSLLNSLQVEHEALLNSTTNEFERTLEVLRQIRKEY